MSAILLDSGIRSQILHIIASVGGCPLPVKTNQHSLKLENSSISGFNGIVAHVASSGNVKLIPENKDSEVFERLDASLKAVESNDYAALLKSLNDTLLLKSYLIGHDLSVADIGAFVCIYSHFAKMSKDDMYIVYPHVTRWFDLIQNRIASNGILAKIPIQHEAPKAEKAKPKAKNKDNDEKEEKKKRF